MDDASQEPDDAATTPAGLRLVRALRGYVNETEIYIGAASREAAMGRTDLAGLSTVMDRGLQGQTTTPGQLSAGLGLSAPATSAMLDRLERLGHVTRKPHPHDRRSVTIEVTDHARAVGGEMFAGLARHLAPVLATRSEAELAALADLLEQVSAATAAARDDL